MDEYRPHVLVVDDLPDTADSLAELLGLWGYDAEARYAGEAALASAQTHRPAVVLLDIGMPRMDGFEFVVRLRELHGCKQTAVIAVSGYTTEACRTRARELGIGHYLLKPADPRLLRALLDRLIANGTPRFARIDPRLHKKDYLARCEAVG